MDREKVDSYFLALIIRALVYSHFYREGALTRCIISLSKLRIYNEGQF